MSEQFEIRRAGEHGAGKSIVVTIPAKFLAASNISKNDYIRFHMEQDKIVMRRFKEKEPT